MSDTTQGTGRPEGNHSVIGADASNTTPTDALQTASDESFTTAAQTESGDGQSATAQSILRKGTFAPVVLAILVLAGGALYLVKVLSPNEPGASLVVSAPSGFQSAQVNPLNDIATGALTFGEASDSYCSGVDPVVTVQAEWLGSQSRFFDGNPAYGKSYILVCLTVLTSPAAAAKTEVALARHFAGRTRCQRT
ncbi:MAG: hypothetical protein WAV54_03610 [Acidimicrobiales bacterium]